jgi:hypothetical protein
VSGSLITDAKDRIYRQEYDWRVNDDGTLTVYRRDGRGDQVVVPADMPLTQPLIALFGLYSGDGAKGTEDPEDRRRIYVRSISFSQTEPNLIRFAVDQFRTLFPGQIRFTFSLGEDAAYFLAGEGADRLQEYYRSHGQAGTPATNPLRTYRPSPDAADLRYLVEDRPDLPDTNESYLAFYYAHKQAMEEILVSYKSSQLCVAGIDPQATDIEVGASLRRPFKKGAREPGGSSRADEVAVGGLNGAGELFLKMIHEVEDSILRDSITSASGLVEWSAVPSSIGARLDLESFFRTSPYGVINGSRPVQLTRQGSSLTGQWRRSSVMTLASQLTLDPLFCYTSGLYLAEGTTDKVKLFQMSTQPAFGMALGFTSSEGTSIELMLRALSKVFPRDQCLDAWKVKVGSQYFPELVVTGLKNGVPMLRGGASGDGKLRTMEISIAIKDWALQVADAALDGQASLLSTHFGNRYSHVEPTGSGVARIDFWASSTICRWYFPILMYTVFGEIVADPSQGFYR